MIKSFPFKKNTKLIKTKIGGGNTPSIFIFEQYEKIYKYKA